jgi:hypothetical protein
MWRVSWFQRKLPSQSSAHLPCRQNLSETLGAIWRSTRRYVTEHETISILRAVKTSDHRLVTLFMASARNAFTECYYLNTLPFTKNQGEERTLQPGIHYLFFSYFPITQIVPKHLVISDACFADVWSTVTIPIKGYINTICHTDNTIYYIPVNTTLFPAGPISCLRRVSAHVWHLQAPFLVMVMQSCADYSGRAD